MESYIKNPYEIEKKSFEIITKELGDRTFPHEIGKVVKRIIHTTADFTFADITVISDEAIKKAKEAIKAGKNIYTDTKMAMAGINKRRLAEFGGEVLNYVSDPDVALKAKEEGITRSIVAMRKAIKENPQGIFVIGNAPTALFELMKQIKEGNVNPSLVIGVPVGFVGAAESKEELLKLDVPYIVTRGRKGGSNVAAAIVNAVMYMI
ncbi:precorrin-8X methylmutase [Paramaledivibacter caminithermalis]|uniref:Precorrin-8X methylmutase n=1 Tax=Paramaledivibacter caminithermalis (strain DSM 15212 / CIP 107654 / DViRD3) TaxID=1121301 RepID=A0A1M6MLL9_PARC5|nr:precorrin-8X methylmutase [Paramaledivibacter caminithermalis]SHJ84314.1 precorrin-8X methylmutase [Paramaledivibacter caminithermalis DSM 15212]